MISGSETVTLIRGLDFITAEVEVEGSIWRRASPPEPEFGPGAGSRAGRLEAALHRIAERRGRGSFGTGAQRYRPARN